MRLRDLSEGTPYRTTHSELFEAAYYKLEEIYPFLVEAYDLLDWTMARNPWAESVPVDAFADRNMRLILTARTIRFPALRVLAEIDEAHRLVRLWHLSLRQTSIS